MSMLILVGEHLVSPDVFWKYLRYVIKHKYYVAQECIKRGLYIEAITHDLSKFLPSEFIPYAIHFYGSGGDINKGRDKTGYCDPVAGEDREFKDAVQLHFHRNKHHWQYWSIDFNGSRVIIDPPKRCLVEMMCDWKGAGKAQGTPDTLAWYRKHKNDIILSDASRGLVEELIGYTGEESDK